MVTLLNTIEDPAARRICADFGDAPDALLEILHGIQHAHGYLPEASLRTVAHVLNISRAEVHGVVTFYHDFKREKQAAQTLKICRAEACQAVGANELIKEAEAAFKVKIDEGGLTVGLEAMYCLGNCALGPAVLVDDELYGRVDIKRLKAISSKHASRKNAGISS